MVVVQGLNHASLLNMSSVPADVAKADLKAEISQKDALFEVGSSVRSFMLQILGIEDSSTLGLLAKQVIIMKTKQCD